MCASKKKGELFNVKRVKKGGFNQMVVQKEEEGVTVYTIRKLARQRNQIYSPWKSTVQNRRCAKSGQFKKRLNNLHSTNIKGNADKIYS